MKILVCIKQVPDYEQIGITEGPDGEAIPGDFMEFKMNRFDEFAAETAIRIRENTAATTVDVLTVGPERSAEAVKRGIGMGADNGIHLQTETGVDFSPSVIAAWIAAYARRKDYHLILTGSMSEDAMNGQVGPMIAAHLDLPSATQVIRTQIAEDQLGVCIEREIEGGNRELLQLKLPAVLAIQTGANQPRYPSLSNLLRANKQGLEQVEARTLLEAAPKEELVGFAMPRKMRAGKHLTGSSPEKAAQLLALLREKAFF